MPVPVGEATFSVDFMLTLKELLTSCHHSLFDKKKYFGFRVEQKEQTWSADHIIIILDIVFLFIQDIHRCL